MQSAHYKVVVMGLSAGGLNALKVVIPAIPPTFPLPIAIVQHMDIRSDSYLADFLDRHSSLSVKEAEDKEPLCPGYIYLAPAGYHLLIEQDQTFSLSVDPRVNYCCPAIDVLFESASDVYKEKLIGVIMTGANADGSEGLKVIKARGGVSIVQNPLTAEAPYMPQAAIYTGFVDYIVGLNQIAPLLVKLSELSAGDNDD